MMVQSNWLCSTKKHLCTYMSFKTNVLLCWQQFNTDAVPRILIAQMTDCLSTDCLATECLATKCVAIACLAIKCLATECLATKCPAIEYLVVIASQVS